MATGFGFASMTPMHSARAGAAAVAWADGTKVLVTGGTMSNTLAGVSINKSAELYDASTHTWTLSEMTTARSGHTATLLQSGQVLVVGGDNFDPATAEVYDPATNSWQKVINNLNAFRINHAATLLDDGRVLISGGAPSTLYTSPPIPNPTLTAAEIFDPGDDPVNGTWTLTSPMNDGRAYHTSTLLLLPTGPVLVAGGFASAGGGDFGQPLSSAEVFDPTTGAWSIISSMNNAHAGHTATLLSSDVVGQFEVLVAGGAGMFEYSTFAELYEPPRVSATGGVVVGGSWVPVGSMNVSRTWHTATALPPLSDFSRRIQQVLVTGGGSGFSGNSSNAQSTEIYDSATGSWTLTGNMTTGRDIHIAALLADGTVLVAGGNPDEPTNSAEIGAGCDANALIVVSPQQTMNYGQVPAGTEGVPPDFAPTVENTGNALLTLTATISGPDAALFALSVPFGPPINLSGTGPCISGPTAGTTTPQNSSVALKPTFSALSPVPKTCQATLTLGGSNAANVSGGQTWTFPLIAQIVPTEPGLVVQIDTPSFPLEGGPVTNNLVITLESQPNESVGAIVRFPPSPRDGPFTWDAGDYVVDASSVVVKVPITFAPQSPGPKTQTLELISNAEGSPYQVLLQGTGD
jgi:hypothetical protein